MAVVAAVACALLCVAAVATISSDNRSIALVDEVDGLELRFNLGGLLRREERFDEAVTHLTAATELAPQDPDAQVELGLALQSLGRLDEAVAHFERAVALTHGQPEVVEYLRGMIEAAGR